MLTCMNLMYLLEFCIMLNLYKRPVTTRVSVATNNANPVPIKDTLVIQYVKWIEMSMKATKFPNMCILTHVLILVGRWCFKTTYTGVTTAIHKPPIKPIQWVNSKRPAKKLNEDLSTIVRAERHIVRRIITNAPHKSGTLKRSISLTSFTLDKLQTLDHPHCYILTQRYVKICGDYILLQQYPRS